MIFHKYERKTKMNFALFEKISFATTGEFKQLNSEDIQKKISKSKTLNYAEMSNLVDYLVIGENPNTDIINQAIQFGIISLNEDEFLKILNKELPYNFKISSSMKVENLCYRFFDHVGLFAKIKQGDSYADFNLNLNQIQGCKEFNNLPYSVRKAIKNKRKRIYMSSLCVV